MKQILGKTSQLTGENVGLRSEMQSMKELIEQLEQDIGSLQNLSNFNRGEAEVRESTCLSLLFHSSSSSPLFPTSHDTRHVEN